MSIPRHTKQRGAVVYLLHFSRPLAHAKHYLGSAKNLDERLAEHQRGQGARLTQVVIELGITFECVRTWKGGRKEERQFKNWKKATALCPLCRQEVNAKRRERYQHRKEAANQ
ncbi:MAG: GIY-YIG nuclease family protein [Pyrinomonadaceae bacterium]|nr:GIY-YIG nuclease family protein [Pyrinomonadaceae bacterium]